ncbi:MAG TPA: formate dehydrogenase subunit delta, partial [Burkholderiaceae bacterium]|nr:formate dehydrogenase subunit delta [Burkholderiaceae bacterium]
MKNINVLIQKANRIGQFFEAMPDRQEGIDGIADHIRKFWEPRMRAAMLQFLDEHPDG